MKTRTRVMSCITAGLLAIAGLVLVPLPAKAAADQTTLDALDAVASAVGVINQAAAVADAIPTLPFTDVRPGDLLRSLADRVPDRDSLTNVSSLVEALEHADTTSSDGKTTVAFGCPDGQDDHCDTPVVISPPASASGLLSIDLPIDIRRDDAPASLVAITDSDQVATPERDMTASAHVSTKLHIERQYGPVSGAGTSLSTDGIRVGGDFDLHQDRLPLRIGIVDLLGDANGSGHLSALLKLVDPNNDGKLTRDEWESVAPNRLVVPASTPEAIGHVDLDLYTESMLDGPTASIHFDKQPDAPATFTGGLGDMSKFDILHPANLRDAVAKLAAILRTAGQVTGQGIPFLGDSANLANAAGLADQLTGIADKQSVSCRMDGSETPVPENTPLPAGTQLRCRAAVSRPPTDAQPIEWKSHEADISGPTAGTVSPTPVNDVLVTLREDGTPNVTVSYSDEKGPQVAGLAARSINELQSLFDDQHIPVTLRWDQQHSAIVAMIDYQPDGPTAIHAPLNLGAALGHGLTNLGSDTSQLAVALGAPRLHAGLGLVLDQTTNAADRIVVVQPGGENFFEIPSAAISATPGDVLEGRLGFLGVKATVDHFALSSPTGKSALTLNFLPSDLHANGVAWPQARSLGDVLNAPADAVTSAVNLALDGKFNMAASAGAPCAAGSTNCLSTLSAFLSVQSPNVLTTAPSVEGDFDSVFGAFADFGDGNPAALLNAILDNLDSITALFDDPDLRTPLPVIGKSLGELVGDVSAFKKAMQDLRGGPGAPAAPPTLQALADRLNALSLNNDVPLSFRFSGNKLAIRFAVDLVRKTISVPFAGGAVGNANNVLHLGNGLTLNADGTLEFSVSIPLVPGTAPTVSGGLNVDLAGQSQLDNAGVGVGPFTLGVERGVAKFGVDVTLDSSGLAIAPLGGVGVDCGTATNGPTLALQGLACVRAELADLPGLVDPVVGVVVQDDGAVGVSAPTIDFSKLNLDFTTMLDAFRAFTNVLPPALKAGQSLPIIGSALDGGADTVTQLNAMVDNLKAHLNELQGRANAKAVGDHITSLLSAPGLPPHTVTVLCGGTTVCTTDNGVTNISDIQINFAVDRPGTVEQKLDLGLPGFPLRINGTVSVATSLTGDVTIGLSRSDGPYLSVPSDGIPFVVGAQAGLGNSTTPCTQTALPGYSASRCVTGTLGLLNVQLADHDLVSSGTGAVSSNHGCLTDLSSKTSVGVCAALRVGGGHAVGGRRVVPLADLVSTPDIAPVVTGGANIDLRFRTGISGDDGLPSLIGTINGGFNLPSSIGADPIAPTLSINQLYADPGTAVQSVLRPIVDGLNQVVSPLIPIFDLLQAPLPVLQQLHDLDSDIPANLLGLAGSVDLGLVQSAAAVVDAGRTLSTLQQPTGLIPLGPTTANGDQPGSMQISPDAAQASPATGDTAFERLVSSSSLRSCSIVGRIITSEPAAPSCPPPADADGEVGMRTLASADTATAVSQPGSCPPADAVPVTLGVTGLEFPVFDNPSSLAGLLLGHDVDLVRYNPPCFAAHLGRHESLGPFFIGPVPVRLGAGIDLNATGRLGLVYDTAGLRAGVRNHSVGSVVEGLALDDWHGDPSDPAELHVDAALTGSASVDAIVASAGIEGGVGLSADLNLHDENHDGKVRLGEVASAISDPSCLFDVNFNAFYFLRAYFEIDYFIGSDRTNFDIVPRTDVPIGSIQCTPLASDEIVNGARVLRLINPTVGAAHFTVRGIPGGVRVARNGRSQDFQGEFARVEGTGTGGDDSFEAAPSTSGAPFNTRVVFDGGAGNDTLVGGLGDDLLTGGKGSDHLRGGDGTDTLVGDSLTNPSVTGDDELDGGAGNDTMYGGPGDDILLGGAGADTEFGNAGDDSLRGASDDNSVEFDSDTLVGGQGNDNLDGGAGDDWMVGGTVAQLNGSVCGIIDTGTPLRPDPTETVPDRDGNYEGQNEKQHDTDDAGFENGGPANDDSLPATVDYLTDPDDPYGNDVLTGGAGNDTINGESGDDVIIGGDGNDTLCGSSGNDTIMGDDPAHPDQTGNDLIEAGPDDDVVDAGPGFDDVEGGAGRDEINGGDGTDVVFGDGADLYRTNEKTAAEQMVAGTLNLTSLFGRMRSVGATGNQHGDNDVAIAGAATTDASTRTSTCDNRTTKRPHCSAGGDGGPLFARAGGPCSPFHSDSVADCITGGDDNDFLFGMVGEDEIDGGAGNDTIYGQQDDDVIRAGAGADTVFGDEGNDIVYGDAGNDTIDGGPGGDTLNGGGDTDKLLGRGGDDTLDGGKGDDSYDGGADEDTLVNSSGADTMVGGSEVDNVTYASSPGPITVTAGDGPASGPGNDGAADERDNIRPDVEDVYGTTAGDTMSGGSTAVRLHGGPGNDTITSGSVDDNDQYGDGGNDTLIGSSARDHLHGGDGNDTIDGLRGNDLLEGDAGDDIISGGPGPSGAGNLSKDSDSIYGGSGRDTVDYGKRSANLTLSLDNTNNDGETTFTALFRICSSTKHNGLLSPSVTVCETTPRVVGVDEQDNVHTDVENVIGGSGADLIEGSAAPNKLVGGSGDDTIRGNGGKDDIYGNAGNDTLTGGADPDALDGGPNVDLCTNDGIDTRVNCEDPVVGGGLPALLAPVRKLLNSLVGPPSLHS